MKDELEKEEENEHKMNTSEPGQWTDCPERERECIREITEARNKMNWMILIKVGGEVTKRGKWKGYSFLTWATGQLAGNEWRKTDMERKNYDFRFSLICLWNFQEDMLQRWLAFWD